MNIPKSHYGMSLQRRLYQVSVSVTDQLWCRTAINLCHIIMSAIDDCIVTCYNRLGAHDKKFYVRYGGNQAWNNL